MHFFGNFFSRVCKNQTTSKPHFLCFSGKNVGISRKFRARAKVRKTWKNDQNISFCFANRVLKNVQNSGKFRARAGTSRKVSHPLALSTKNRGNFPRATDARVTHIVPRPKKGPKYWCLLRENALFSVIFGRKSRKSGWKPPEIIYFCYVKTLPEPVFFRPPGPIFPEISGKKWPHATKKVTIGRKKVCTRR